MKTLVSFPALTLALAASLGMQGCGGDTKSKEDDERAGSGGKTNTGGAATGGKTVTGGTASGGVSTSGGRTSVARPCEDPQPVLDAEGNPTGYETCANGGGHRVSAEECAIRLPREDAECPAEDAERSTCRTDADCSDGPYGTCGPLPQALTCGCAYGCKTDADCAGGAVCLCFGVAGTCSPATCRTDADCEEGFECRGFQDPTTSLCDMTRFECQTAEDAGPSTACCRRLT